MARRTRLSARLGTVAGVLLLAGGASAVGAGFASQAAAPVVPVSVPAPAGSSDPTRVERSGPDIGGGRPSFDVSALPPSEPVRLDVPSIEVHSDLSTVGVNPDGTIEVPAPGPLYDLPAWYRYSPSPGELGPAVIEGHLDSPDGPSIFFRLGELRAGDEVAVTRADGSTAVFRVTSVRRYAKDAFPTAEVYGNTPHPGLRLITCGGGIDPATGHYADNVVVYASLASVRVA